MLRKPQENRGVAQCCTGRLKNTSFPPGKKSELPGSPKIQELDEDKADEPSLLPMTPESKQLAAVIATAVATAMAGKSASPDSSSSMVRYSAGVSLASRTRSIGSLRSPST